MIEAVFMLEKKVLITLAFIKAAQKKYLPAILTQTQAIYKPKQLTVKAFNHQWQVAMINQ